MYRQNYGWRSELLQEDKFWNMESSDCKNWPSAEWKGIEECMRFLSED